MRPRLRAPFPRPRPALVRGGFAHRSGCSLLRDAEKNPSRPIKGGERGGDPPLFRRQAGSRCPIINSPAAGSGNCAGARLPSAGSPRPFPTPERPIVGGAPDARTRVLTDALGSSLSPYHRLWRSPAGFTSASAASRLPHWERNSLTCRSIFSEDLFSR